MRPTRRRQLFATWRARGLRVAVLAVAAITLTAGGATGVSTVRADSNGAAHQFDEIVSLAAESLTSAMDLPVPTQIVRTADRAAHPRREPIGTPADYPGNIAQVPVPAVAAYQRAETIINQVNKCGLDWYTLAAIGRVESNHGLGEENKHQVTSDATVTPAFIAKPLNGNGERATVVDTDAGRLDNDKTWDRPIGPMGLLPSSWLDVGVDADSDGERNPHDFDDAALAAAVQLCAKGGFEAGEGVGLRKALRQYHNAAGFVATVLSLRNRYQQQSEELLTADPPLRGVPIPGDLAAVCVNCDLALKPEPAKPDESKDPQPTDPKPSESAEPTLSPEPTTPESPGPSDPETSEPADPEQEPTDPGTEEPDPEESSEPCAEQSFDPDLTAEEPTDPCAVDPDDPDDSASAEPTPSPTSDPSNEPTTTP